MSRFSKYLQNVLLVVLVLAPALVSAENPKPNDKEKVDAVLVLDASGSMLKTDPARLRSEGAKLFTQFLRAGDRLGIIEFSNDSKIIRPLAEYEPGQQAAVSSLINGVSNNGEYTDLLAGVRAARDVLAKEQRSDAESVIILLSDGKMDPAPNSGSAQTLTTVLLEEVIPELRTKGIKLYTLSFSDQADKELLSQLSVATNAAHWYTPTPDDIHKSFADLFVVVKKPQMVPLTSKGFRIDQDIQEATFYINREGGEEATIVTPGGKKITFNNKGEGIKWFRSDKFDVITVESPESGQWELLGLEKDEGFATLLTNLKLTTSWPGVITAGEDSTLQARLFESSKPVVLPEMTGVVKYAFQITPTDKVSEPIIRELLNDDGKHGDEEKQDGIYSATVNIDEPGEYRLRVLASGPTFERHQQIAFRVKPRLVKLSVVEGAEAEHVETDPAHDEHAKDEHGHADEHGSADHGAPSHAATSGDYLLAELSPELANARDVQLEVVAVDKQRKRFKLPAIKVDHDYRIETNKFPHDGEFKVMAKVTASLGKKQKVQGESQELTYTKITREGEETATVVVVEEGAKEEAPKVEKEKFPWVFLVLLILINGGIGAAGILKLKKAGGPSSNDQEQEKFDPIDPILAAIAAIEAKSQETEVDLNSPIFTEGGVSEIPTQAVTEKASESAAAPVPEAPEEEEAQDELLDELADEEEES